MRRTCLRPTSSMPRGSNWTYLFVGPFADFGSYRAWLEQVAKADDPLFHTIIDLKTGKAVGVATFMRIDRPNGVIEVGNINYSPLLQRTPAATEAMFLMMARVFDELGLPALRMEVRQPECAVAGGGAAAGVSVRGHLPAGGHLQEPQPRHGLVFDDRQRMAGPETGLRAMAGARQLRCRGATAAQAQRADSCGARLIDPLCILQRDAHFKWEIRAADGEFPETCVALRLRGDDVKQAPWYALLTHYRPGRPYFDDPAVSGGGVRIVKTTDRSVRCSRACPRAVDNPAGANRRQPWYAVCLGDDRCNALRYCTLRYRPQLNL